MEILDLIEKYRIILSKYSRSGRKISYVIPGAVKVMGIYDKHGNGVDLVQPAAELDEIDRRGDEIYEYLLKRLIKDHSITLCDGPGYYGTGLSVKKKMGTGMPGVARRGNILVHTHEIKKILGYTGPEVGRMQPLKLTLPQRAAKYWLHLEIVEPDIVSIHYGNHRSKFAGDSEAEIMDMLLIRLINRFELRWCEGELVGRRSAQGMRPDDKKIIKLCRTRIIELLKEGK